jgi:hypothetical protein
VYGLRLDELVIIQDESNGIRGGNRGNVVD